MNQTAVRSLRSLHIYLETGCNFTSGALRLQISAARFRNNVVKDIQVLERSLSLPVKSLRAAYLRSISGQLTQMLEKYEAPTFTNTEGKPDIAH